MSADISRTIEQERLENASGQVDAQLESDGSQVELSGLFRVTSHSELVHDARGVEGQWISDVE